ncbi:MAG: HD domain-containing protein [bacterium]|nr:HD domain-containing protein [bacterium]
MTPSRVDVPALGLLSVPEFTARILEPWPEYRSRIDDLFAVLESALARIDSARSFERLAGLFQFGIKVDARRHRYSMVREEAPAILIATAPFLQSRQMHSRSVAAHLAALGIRIGVPMRELSAAVLASLVHDIGHSAYCHDGDDFLVRSGSQSHERRGIKIIAEDDEIREAFGLIDARLDSVTALVREEGRLGLLQKLADPLGYLLLDAETIGERDWMVLSQQVIESVRNSDGERLFASSADPIVKLLKRRAALMQQLYYASHNRVAVAAFSALLGVMVERKVLTISEIEQGVDVDVEMRVSEAVLDRAMRWPSWVLSLWNIAHGFEDELGRWQCMTLGCAQNYEAYVSGRHIRRATQQNGTFFVIEPFDYSRKNFLVVMPDQKIQIIQTPLDNRIPADRGYDDARWHVFSFRG